VTEELLKNGFVKDTIIAIVNNEWKLCPYCGLNIWFYKIPRFVYTKCPYCDVVWTKRNGVIKEVHDYATYIIEGNSK
jgi:hypothetical protein